MPQLSDTLTDNFALAYRDFARRVRDLTGNLTDEQFWARPYPYGNSIGHLTLHVTGNLNYYIGARIARTGYVREREREFTEQTRPSKEEVLGRLDEAVSLVVRTLKAETEGGWSERYEAEGAGETVRDRFGIYLRCAAHFQHHVGQMIYLAKELSK
ncbi:MAG TPA: DinB family protein [Pyrinomonadaceae bacterium]|jgi:hypothetical protein|nr:DinB family protein [Pyrinomonadaceae bacterium]